MKTYTRILSFSILISICMLSACKDFLDRPLENQAEATTIDYTNPSLMYQPVSGAYKSATRGGYATWIPTFLKTSQSDDIDPQTGYSEVNQLIHNGVSGSAIKAFWALNDYWNGYYGAIITCNSALAELAKFGANLPAGDAANQALLVRYQAEVRFLAALGHYYLSRTYGDVPILGPESINPSYLDTVRKTDLDGVRQFLISEMDFCIANLEDVAPNKATHVGGVTKYTALMLKAKVAMDMAGNDNGSPFWDMVIDATNQIITSNKFVLFPDFYQLWKKPGKLSDEAILEFQYSDFGSPTGDIVTSGNEAQGLQWANFFLFQGPENTYGQPVAGNGWLIPSDGARSFLVARNDSVRLKTIFQRCGINGEPGTYAVTPDGDTVSGNVARKKYFNGKTYLPKSQTNGRVDYLGYTANQNIRVWRFAETLLMNAEAKIRKGQNGDVPFNLVRVRAKLLPLTNVTLQQVLDERRAEFMCEWWGERFNDLVRTDRAEDVFSGFVKGESEFWPIPQAQEDININLKD